MTATVSTAMSTRERIFQSILFEVTAILIMVPVNMLLLKQGAGGATYITIAISTAAMCWCFLHNKVFDHYYGAENKLQRTKGVRLLHAVTFEIGFFAFSYPFLLSVTDLTLLEIMYRTAFVSTFFMVFTVVYNYVYDLVRSKIKS